MHRLKNRIHQLLFGGVAVPVESQKARFDRSKVLPALNDLIACARTSNDSDIAGIMNDLAELGAEVQPLPAAAAAQGRPKILLVEDDFSSRLVLPTFLSRCGECHIAVNGKEAVAAFGAALDSGQEYGRIRALEESRGILSTFGVKITKLRAVMNAYQRLSPCRQDIMAGY